MCALSGTSTRIPLPRASASLVRRRDNAGIAGSGARCLASDGRVIEPDWPLGNGLGPPDRARACQLRAGVASGQVRDRRYTRRTSIVATFLMGGAVLAACGYAPQGTSTLRVTTNYVRSACASNGFPHLFNRQPIGTRTRGGYGVAFLRRRWHARCLRRRILTRGVRRPNQVRSSCPDRSGWPTPLRWTVEGCGLL